MNSQEFQENALKTESIPAEVGVSYDALILAFDIAVLSGEVVDVIKKSLFYGKPIDSDKLAGQLRDLSEKSMLMRAMNFDGSIVPGPKVTIEDTEDEVKNLRIVHGTLGMFTESSEMIAAVRKYAIAQGNGNDIPLDVVNILEEIGDSDWYKVILHDALGVPEEQSRATVIAKLRKRYPGKFTAEDALNRDLDAEREILEDGMAPLEEAA